MIYTNGSTEPLEVVGGLDERGLCTLEVTWLAVDLASAWAAAPATYANLKRTGMRMNKIPGGGYKVTGTYEGTNPDGADLQPGQEDSTTYELDVSQAMSPISQHPRIADLEKKYGAITSDEKTGLLTFPRKAPAKAGGPPTGEDRGDVSEAFGITDYLDVGTVWRKMWMEESNALPQELLAMIGRIDNPTGPVPSVPGRNWIKTGARARARGRSWELTNEWTLSGRGGWLTSIYQGSK